MRDERFMYFCIKNPIGTQGEHLSTVKVLLAPDGLCCRPFWSGGPGFIIILCCLLRGC